VNILVIDLGGGRVKMLATGQDQPRQFRSGPTFEPQHLIAEVERVAQGWEYDVISLGYPGVVLHGRPIAEPHNLAKGWVHFDYRSGFGRPIKIINDAAMQGIGSYQGGRMLFLGLGSCLIVDGVVEPMELGHLPYKKGTYEQYVGRRGLEKWGRKKWRRYVADVVERFTAALEPDDVVLGGGNVGLLKELPPGCRAGNNTNAFVGGFRLWEERPSATLPSCREW
jgi:polyphosphate glucokinase